MRHMTLLLCSVFVCLLCFSCKDRHLYYIHHTRFGRFDYRIPCNPELVDKVNTNWLKHGKYHCHYYNQFVQDFPNNYKDCIVGRDISIIKELFGKPNLEAGSQIEYIIADRCATNMRNFSKLIFVYDEKGKITDVAFRWFIISY